MIADLKPYPAYRDSGLPWLGDVPLRTLEEITADIFAIEQEAEGLLDGLLKGGAR